MSQLKLYLFGTPRVEVNEQPVDVPRRKAKAILIYLAVTDQAHQRDALATLFWPDVGQSAARGSLRRELYTLQQLVGADWFTLGREAVSVKTNANIWLDTDAFEVALARWEAHDHAAETSCPNCIDALSTAADLYQGDFLTDLTLPDCPDFNDWRHFHAEKLRRSLANALSALVRFHSAEAGYQTAITYAQRWLELDQLDESIHRTLMTLYATVGQQRNAQRQYQACVRILESELGIAPTPETTELFDTIRTRRFSDKRTRGQEDERTRGQEDGMIESSSPPVLQSSSPPVTPSPPHNLPAQSTSFVGRQDELVAIQKLLLDEVDCRLLTLLGPGGIGKTRLSLQVGQQIVDGEQMPLLDGVYFVPLAAVSDADYMVRAIADAVDYTFQGSAEPQTQLETFLNAKRLLLIIDNFEHLLDGADLLTALLQRASDLLLLVTSREALNLPAEWVYPLGGLTVPTPHDSPDEIAANSAVQLFLQRARRADAGFALVDDNVSHVIRICQLVDGMPLGLELAAAWIHTLAVDEIADEIATNIDILASEMRNIPARHRSLRAVFEQTWQRLSAQEQRALCQLAVCRGGFTRASAQHIANASIMLISALIEKALVRHDAGRYNMHEMLRQFAFEQLDDGEKQTIQSAHSCYYGGLLDAQRQHIMTAAEDTMLRTITTDFDNVLDAWQHLVENIKNGIDLDGSSALVGRYAPIVSVYFERRGLFREGQQALQRALSALQDGVVQPMAHDVTARALPAHESFFQLQIEYVAIGMNLGQYLVAKESLTALLPILDKIENKELLAKALAYLGRAYLRLGDFSEALQTLEQALALYDEIGLQLESTISLIHMGMLQRRLERYADARTYYLQAVQIYEEVGYAAGIARCLSNIGSTYSGKTQMAAAIDYYQRAYKIAEAHDNRRWLGITLSNLGSCFQMLDDYQASREHYEKSLIFFREIGEKRWITVSLAELSFTLIALQDWNAARLTLHESLSYARESQLVVDGILALGASALLLAHQQQDALAVAIATHVLADSRARNDARVHCQTLLSTLAAKMSETAYATAQFHGNSTPFALIVETALDALSKTP